MAKRRTIFGEITEENVDEYIQFLVDDTKGPHIVQSIGFNKQDPRQLKLLRHVFLESTSFGGYVKQLLALSLHASLPHDQQSEPIYKDNSIRSSNSGIVKISTALRNSNPNKFT